MSYKNIKINKEHHVGMILLNRPKALNALNKETIIELIDAVKDFTQDKMVKVGIISGEGKAFVAGADIKEMNDMTPLQAKEFAVMGHQLMQLIESSSVPFIAAVNGFALGGGCELMLACDLCLASSQALFGQPEINLGIHPGFGGTQRLVRRIGKIKALDLLLTGRNIKADEALRLGLINKVVEADLMDEAKKLAESIAMKSSVQIGFIKELVHKGSDIDLKSACDLEISYFSTSFSTHDQKEGMAAFVEKRKANFKDE